MAFKIGSSPRLFRSLSMLMSRPSFFKVSVALTIPAAQQICPVTVPQQRSQTDPPCSFKFYCISRGFCVGMNWLNKKLLQQKVHLSPPKNSIYPMLISKESPHGNKQCGKQKEAKIWYSESTGSLRQI